MRRLASGRGFGVTDLREADGDGRDAFAGLTGEGRARFDDAREKLELLHRLQAGEPVELPVIEGSSRSSTTSNELER